MKKLISIAALLVVGIAGFAGAAFAQSVTTTATSTITETSTTPSQTIQINPQSLPDGAVGVLYSENITASSNEGGPYTFTISSGALPAGITLSNASNTAAATIVGTPETTGQASFGITAVNSSTSQTQSYTITIDASTQSQTPSSTTITPIISSTPTIITASTTTTANIALQNELNSLMDQLTFLQNEIAAASVGATVGSGASGGATVPPALTGPVFDRDLTVGSNGADVLALQQFLNSNGIPITASGPGSPGNETGYFGTLTATALATWQAANGISPAKGYYGPATRAKIGPMLTAGSNGSDNSGTMNASSDANSAPMIPAPAPTTPTATSGSGSAGY